jgi:hypothetical protein
MIRFWHNISLKGLKFIGLLLFIVLLSACGKKGDVIGEISSEESLECIECSVFTLMYDSIGSNVSLLHTQFTKASMPIMMVAFSIWLALRLLKFVSSITETNVSEVWNEILRKAFICVFCGILASSPEMLSYTLNVLIFPIYKAFLELGITILQSSLPTSASSMTIFGKIYQIAEVKMVCALPSGATFETGFPSSIRESIECMIKILTGYLTVGREIAWTVMSESGGSPWYLSLTGTLLGWLLWCMFTIVKWFFVFYLVDIIFQMGIIILLLPLFILSYAFGPTKKWTTIGLNNILASAAFLMCFSIIVAMVLSAMVGLVNDNPNIFNPEDAESSMKDYSIGFLCMMMIAFLIYGSMGVADQMTSSLIGTGVSARFQQNLKAMLQAAGSMAWTAIGSLFSFGLAAAAKSSVGWVSTLARGVKNVSAVRGKLQRYAGRK